MLDRMRLPTGIVTFLFTDIEASTRHLAADPEAYPAIIAAQRQLIAAAVAEHGGVVVAHDGDACFVAFGDATAAVEAAARAQQALIEHRWPNDDVRVRFGLHTGPTELAAGDYYGLAVHTASRVADAAHGGQILLSEATRAAGLPVGWTCRDLGLHRLRGIDEKVRLHQLEGRGLLSRFPAPRTVAPARTLHVPTTSLVGRQSETDAVAYLVQRHRIVTLLGPGGIGKTRLAINVGSRATGSFPDGVWFADLTRVDDPDAVGEAIAEAVGVAVGGVGALSAVAEYVADKRALLIVDNVEHVIDCAPGVAALIDETGQLSVLATSRERMRLHGEHVYEVEPLDVGRGRDAERLFVERARAVRPDFALADEQREAVAEICSRLDGLPLAIELAAARCRALEPAQIAARLRQRPLVLAGGSRDVHARQQTIRSTIEWSYQLLTPDEQAVLARLAVFATPIRPDAIDHVLGDAVADDLDAALEGLIDKSLLQQRPGPDGGVRLRMLELVREFAAERLAELGDGATLRGRHASHYTTWVERAAGDMLRSRPDHWVRRIDAEFADVDRAFEWSIKHRPTDGVRLFGALGLFFHRTGMLHVADRWMRAVQGLTAEPQLDARRAISCAFVHFGLLDFERARSAVEHARAVSHETGDLLYEAYATIDLAHTYLGSRADHERALALVRRGADLAHAAGAPTLVGMARNIEGELSRVHGDDDTADAAYRSAIALARVIGDHQRDAVCHGNRVYIATRRGALTEALEFARYAVMHHQRHGHRNQLPWVSIALAGVLIRQDRVADAAMLVASAETAAQRLELHEMAGDIEENERIRALIAERAGDDLPRWHATGRTTPLDEALRIALGPPPQAASAEQEVPLRPMGAPGL
ncbi:MAG TPA: adenylate/guanylate cyclase domain-containing protein [Euzebyales bacterium]